MGQTLGTGDYRYEEVEDWTQVDFEGVASDMATDSQDLVYLAVRTTQAIDDNTGVVLVLDREGRYVRSIGGDRLRTPHHLWVSPDDEVYVTDCFDHAVRVYTTSGEQVQVIGIPGQPGMPGGPFNQPTCAVRSAHSGDVFVADGYRQNRVHRFSRDGELKLSWGSGDRNQYDWEVLGSGSRAPARENSTPRIASQSAPTTGSTSWTGATAGYRRSTRTASI